MTVRSPPLRTMINRARNSAAGGDAGRSRRQRSPQPGRPVMGSRPSRARSPPGRSHKTRGSASGRTPTSLAVAGGAVAFRGPRRRRRPVNTRRPANLSTKAAQQTACKTAPGRTESFAVGVRATATRDVPLDMPDRESVSRAPLHGRDRAIERRLHLVVRSVAKEDRVQGRAAAETMRRGNRKPGSTRSSRWSTAVSRMWPTRPTAQSGEFTGP